MSSGGRKYMIRNEDGTQSEVEREDYMIWQQDQLMKEEKKRKEQEMAQQKTQAESMAARASVRRGGASLSRSSFQRPMAASTATPGPKTYLGQ